VIIVDKLLIGGIRFVLDKIASAVESEMNNEDVLREELLAAQMRHELGEITDDEFAEIEAAVLGALREIQERKRGETGPREALRVGGEGTRVTGIDVSFGGDEAETESVLGGAVEIETETETHIGTEAAAPAQKRKSRRQKR
jgi:hypothetical protein